MTTGSTMPSPPIVQILDASYIQKCAHVMAQAFVNSPVYLYLFQDIENVDERIQALQWLFERNVAGVLKHKPDALRGILSSVDENNAVNPPKIICCFMWVPSPLPPVTLWSLIQAGFWQLPFRFGWKTTERLMSILEAIDKDREVHHQTSHSDSPASETVSFISLERLVVLPEYQGKGYGSNALGSLLKDVDSQDPKPQVRLSTQEERNVRFYKRLGFEVIDQRQFDPTESQEDTPKNYGFTHWIMLRK
jgi:ribosomal protein S18 acetylase RimI-like enzyme